jgi:hypothetical protein
MTRIAATQIQTETVSYWKHFFKIVPAKRPQEIFEIAKPGSRLFDNQRASPIGLSSIQIRRIRS